MFDEAKALLVEREESLEKAEVIIDKRDDYVEVNFEQVSNEKELMIVLFGDGVEVKINKTNDNDTLIETTIVLKAEKTRRISKDNYALRMTVNTTDGTIGEVTMQINPTSLNNIESSQISKRIFDQWLPKYGNKSIGIVATSFFCTILREIGFEVLAGKIRVKNTASIISRLKTFNPLTGKYYAIDTDLSYIENSRIILFSNFNKELDKPDYEGLQKLLPKLKLSA